MKKGILYTGLITLAILSIPLLTNAPWTIFDYIVATIILTATGVALVVATKKITKRKKKVLVSLGIIIFALYIWAELAVGIFTKLGS